MASSSRPNQANCSVRGGVMKVGCHKRGEISSKESPIESELRRCSVQFCRDSSVDVRGRRILGSIP
jgi:hypothetical protein